jgi:hypothetical protein
MKQQTLFLIFIILFIVIGIVYSLNLNNNILNENNNNNILNERKFKSIGEELSCQIFEEYLGYNVEVNKRPNFLKNPKTGQNLELDIFDPKTKIAIEYNGEQHYNYPNIFHRDREKFDEQVYRDNLKLELTSNNNIYLIHIPYYIDTCKFKNNKYVKINKLTKEYRKDKIKEYLLPKLDTLINGLND